MSKRQDEALEALAEELALTPKERERLFAEARVRSEKITAARESLKASQVVSSEDLATGYP